MKNGVHISNLAIGYNHKTILENINLESETNKMIALFGRNGQGKSTLLKTISGLLPSINGNFKFEGIDILKLSEKERAKLLSIVSTTQTSIGGITVKDFIAFGRFPYTNWLGINTTKDYQEIDNAITLCKLTNLANRNYDELSDGEKQKVNIARAIAQNTPLIILDEPTVHLDLINKIEVFKLLKELSNNHNKTIIISTHQIEYALQICDEIWLINNAQVNTYSPNTLINENKLSELFDEEIISFDKDSQSFRLK
ncbi:MAG: ABC transporter ATP-binding protein [Flavobacteriales bacterium]|nr:ABC transporter ATP-binding protein [Flavobacteriales bacterium]NQX96676.1 ABC transporter ATP-binding protein [Flavobacteriales bacterium]